jgi:hypothetical protein
MKDLATVARKAAKLDAEIKEKTAELKKLKSQLVASGVADYGCAQVIEPGPSIKPADEVIEEIRAVLPREHFGKLFESTLVIRPVKAFREVLAALCKPGVVKSVLSRVEIQGTPYVLFSKNS